MPVSPRAQQAHRGVGSDGAADDEVDVRMLLEDFFQKDQLDLGSGVAPFRGGHLSGALGDRCAKAGLHEADPSDPFGSGKPGDLDGRAAFRVRARQIGADRAPHLRPGNGGLRSDPAVIDVVDGGGHRDALCNPGDQWGEAGVGHRTHDEGVRPGGDAALDLGDLPVQIRVAARLHDAQRHAEPPGLLGHAVVDAEPVGILEVRIGGAEAPFPRRRFERRILYALGLPVIVEWRVPALQQPGLRAGVHLPQPQRAGETGDEQCDKQPAT